jgi:NAD(P)H-dependent FMN reductase
MRILAINGSPHQGNTSEKISSIQEKLSMYDDVEFEIIHLKDCTIEPCKGCFNCFIKGPDSCPLKDDKDLIEQKMKDADGLIFATPVYSMHVSYLLKNLIDRMAYTFHRPCFFGKKSISLAVAGNIGLKETNYYLTMMANAWGFENIGTLAYREAPKNTPMKISPLKKDETNKILYRFYEHIKYSKTQKLTLRDHLTFRIMQTVYMRLENMSPYDYNYWNEMGWFDKKTTYFYTRVKSNFFYDGIARLMAWIRGRQMDKSFAKE